ncbi:hypothetical protein Dtox_1825 [Desulfofarcimen acetoxidans DSM 771]|uniref:Uncharacterized protein n=1 Tax=Desulfofarcimen acetoxidans (strain ATCC 49208 / DSM 771 / KCTC 5769 / VKM B-1644 / 5575) TaxID=485916 RepID=C8VXL9_DESAS|nr:hypothetical protein [Desulfofarcimen acetoxidans]ACV62675.1 hypothetical protein Dtox_1825 [Desulfofarcimen acetoxidans DSM 771]
MLVILKDKGRSTSCCELRIDIDSIKVIGENTEFVDLTISFYNGNCFSDIKASIDLNIDDLTTVLKKLTMLATDSVQYIDPYDPGFFIYSIPETDPINDELVFRIFVSIDAGLINGTGATFSGPSLALTVKQLDINVFVNEIRKQLIEFPRTLYRADI